MNRMRKFFEIAAGLDGVAVTITLAALVVVFVWIGGLKAFAYQDESIVPLVANSPMMSFVYRQPAGEYREHMNPAGAEVPANREWHERNNTYPVAYALGVAIVAFGVMMALHHWLPGVAAIGSLMVALMSVVTLSFIITTPECWVPPLGSPHYGFPLLSGVGGAIVKDAVLLGAGLVTMVDSAKAYLRKTATVAKTPRVADLAATTA